MGVSEVFYIFISGPEAGPMMLMAHIIYDQPSDRFSTGFESKLQKQWISNHFAGSTW